MSEVVPAGNDGPGTKTVIACPAATSCPAGAV
jgi:hypothetical protein